MLPTPLGSDGEHGGPNQRGGSGDLRLSSVNALFPTPEAKLADSGPDHARAGRPRSGSDDLATAAGELLPTPQAHDAKGGKTPEQVATMRAATGAGVRNLNEVAEAELLPTPSTSNRDGNTQNNRGDLLLPGVAEQVELLPTPVVTDSESARNSTAGRSVPHTGHSGDTLLDALTIAGLADHGSLLATDAASSGPSDGGRHTPQLRAVDDLLPTPTATDAERGQTHEDDGKRGGRMSSTDVLFPTPTTEPQTGNGHARDLGGEVTLLPTPAAGQFNDSEDAEQWQARHDAYAGKGDDATRSGLPLPVAVQALEDGPEDATGDGERVRWGKYRAAILRTQAVAGRLAPSPTKADGKGGKRRLAALFVEWMMLLPLGWVSGVPGISRRDQLKALGNGVVPLQASVATVILLGRVSERLRERHEDRSGR